MTSQPPVRVLIVDDEPFVVMSVMAILEDNDIAAEAVDSGEEALELVGSSEYDIVLVDLRLPSMQGDELIVRLHELRPNMKFAIHTGSTWFEPTDDLKKAGIKREHLLYKPVVDLVEIVRVVLDLAGRSGE